MRGRHSVFDWKLSAVNEATAVKASEHLIAELKHCRVNRTRMDRYKLVGSFKTRAVWWDTHPHCQQCLGRHTSHTRLSITYIMSICFLCNMLLYCWQQRHADTSDSFKWDTAICLHSQWPSNSSNREHQLISNPVKQAHRTSTMNPPLCAAEQNKSVMTNGAPDK